MFVVTLPTSAADDPASYSQKAKKAGANILEIRGDLTPNVEQFDSALPLLVSPRGTGNGLVERLKPRYTDLELDEDGIGGGIRIGSYHNYKETPSLEELKKISQELIDQGAEIPKIAVQINSYIDLKTLEELRASVSENQQHIILGMGPKAHWNRMLSPLKNAFTYTFIEGDQEAAPGQVPLNMYKLTAHCKEPKIYGLIGGMECVKSLSPQIHNTLFHTYNIDAFYVLYPTESLEDLMENQDILGNHGFSITAPWKKDIMNMLGAELIPHLTVDPLVEKLQSMNTAVKGDDGSWTGYNTDVAGITEAYPFLKNCSSVAILGSGGVVPSVIEACQQCDIENISIFARNKEEREKLAEKFGVRSAPLEELEASQVSVILNTIPTDIEISLPTPMRYSRAIDLRYFNTSFLEQAEKAGYEIGNGLPMLKCQALKQFELFTKQEGRMTDIGHISAA